MASREKCLFSFDLDGNELKIPLAKLSEEDRKHIQTLQVHQSTKPESPSKSKTSGISSQDIKLVREIAEVFYNDLRTKERSESKKMLTGESQTICDEGKADR